MYIHIAYSLYWKRCLSSTYQTNQTNPNPPQVRTPLRASTVNNPISEVKVWVLSRWTMVEVLWEISTGPSYHHIRWPLGVGESAGWKVLWDFVSWLVLHIPGLANKNPLIFQWVIYLSFLVRTWLNTKKKTKSFFGKPDLGKCLEMLCKNHHRFVFWKWFFVYANGISLL